MEKIGPAVPAEQIIKLVSLYSLLVVFLRYIFKGMLSIKDADEEQNTFCNRIKIAQKGKNIAEKKNFLKKHRFLS